MAAFACCSNCCAAPVCWLAAAVAACVSSDTSSALAGAWLDCSGITGIAF